MRVLALCLFCGNAGGSRPRYSSADHHWAGSPRLAKYDAVFAKATGRHRPFRGARGRRTRRDHTGDLGEIRRRDPALQRSAIGRHCREDSAGLCAIRQRRSGGSRGHLHVRRAANAGPRLRKNRINRAGLEGISKIGGRPLGPLAAQDRARGAKGVYGEVQQYHAPDHSRAATVSDWGRALSQHANRAGDRSIGDGL
jgi:hypothetical protein